MADANETVYKIMRQIYNRAFPNGNFKIHTIERVSSYEVQVTWSHTLNNMTSTFDITRLHHNNRYNGNFTHDELVNLALAFNHWPQIWTEENKTAVLKALKE